MQHGHSHFRKSLRARSQVSQIPESLRSDDLLDEIEDWCSHGARKDCSPKTLDMRRRIAAQLDWFLTSREFKKCGEREIGAFLDHVKNGHMEPGGRWGLGGSCSKCLREVTRSTRHTYFTYLRAFFNWLLERRKIAASPFEFLESCGPTREKPDPFQPEHVVAMLAQCARTVAPCRNRCIIYLIYDTGIRREELAGIRISDIDMRQRLIRVRGKGDKTRLVAFGNEAKQAIYECLAERGNDLEHEHLIVGVGGHRPGDPMTGDGIYTAFRQIAEFAGINLKKMSPHVMRHSFAVEFLAGGAQELQLMEQLGHTNLEMTKVYVKIGGAKLSEQHRRFSPGDALKEKKKGRPRQS